MNVLVCDRWHSFENFLEDMGERPLGMTLDRIKSYQDYRPDNCQWADSGTQAKEKRKPITFNGKTLCEKEWAKELGIKRSTLSMRFRYGWSVERALTTR